MLRGACERANRGENIVQRERRLSHILYANKERKRERERDEGRGEQVRCHAGCEGGWTVSASSVNHPLPFSFPFQMASRRTSFPRLTASRHAEGNENNEIQRSSVTYARRAPSLNSHLYYLSGSKSTHPSLPPLSAVRFTPPGGVNASSHGAQQRTNKGGKLISAMGLRSFTNAPY